MNIELYRWSAILQETNNIVVGFLKKNSIKKYFFYKTQKKVKKTLEKSKTSCQNSMIYFKQT